MFVNMTQIIGLDDYKGTKLEKAMNQNFLKARGQNKVSIVMKEFKDGKLKDSHGNLVTDRKQAVAIAMSEAGLNKEIKKAEKIKGGAGDGKTAKDISEKYGVSLEYVNKQIEIGIKVEYEHTKERDLAKEIAIDHLWKDGVKYYIELNKMEKKLEKGGLFDDYIAEIKKVLDSKVEKGIINQNLYKAACEELDILKSL